MFSWLEKLEYKRWWNMTFVVGIVFAVLFGTKTIDIIDPTAGFLMSLAIIFFSIAEAANHKKITQYKTVKQTHYDPYLTPEFFWDEIRNTPPLDIPIGNKYVRRPVFIGIVLDIVAAILFAVGIVKLF